MGTYSLSRAFQVPITVNVYSAPVGKTAMYRTLRLNPGEKRRLPEDDDAFVKSIKGLKTKKPYSEKIEEHLKELGIEYEVTVCKTCGGRKRYVQYPTVEVEK